jgi:hypothetical protein
MSSKKYVLTLLPPKNEIPSRLLLENELAVTCSSFFCSRTATSSIQAYTMSNYLFNTDTSKFEFDDSCFDNLELPTDEHPWYDEFCERVTRVLRHWDFMGHHNF